MPRPEHFGLIVGIGLALVVAWVFLLGMTNRRRGGTPGLRRVRRDVIGDGVITPRQVDRMHARDTRDRVANGRDALSRHEYEAQVVAERQAMKRE